MKNLKNWESVPEKTTKPKKGTEEEDINPPGGTPPLDEQ